MNRFGKLFTSATNRWRARERRTGRVTEQMDGWLGVVIMIGLGVGFAAVMIGLSVLLGPRNPTPEKLAPYECGMPAVGDARERHSVKFYLVAMIFLLFDIEIAFLYPWAVALRDLGWPGFVQLVTFFLVLTVGYVYVWRKGVLDWGPSRRERSDAGRRAA
jgi:NADH-quinone oxidoreductase subunit A